MQNYFYLSSDYFMKFSRMLKHLLLLSFLFTTSACNEYWWTRGQAPAPDELLKRALKRVEENHTESKYKRDEIYAIASSISQYVVANDAYSVETLSAIEDSLKNLEGKLSYGNRAPYSELSGQLRQFQKTQNIENQEPLRLFYARLLFFLSSELKVPAPDLIPTEQIANS